MNLVLYLDGGVQKTIPIPAKPDDSRFFQERLEAKRKVMGDMTYLKWLETFTFDLLTKGEAE